MIQHSGDIIFQIYEGWITKTPLHATPLQWHVTVFKHFTCIA